MKVEPRYKLLTLHTLIPQLHVCPHTYFYMVRAPTEYGGSTVLYTACVVYTVFTIFKLLCTAYMHIFIVRENWNAMEMG